MKKFFYSIIASISIIFSQITHADDVNYLGIENSKLRTGDIHFDDIPKAIISVTNFLLGLSATIAVVAIIYGAFRIVLGSVPGDKDSGKKIVMGAITGFVVAVSGWLVINTLISNL